MIALLLALAAQADPWTEVAETAGLPVPEVRALVEGHARKQQSVLDRMATPWEARPWHAYFPIFLTRDRLAKGLAFWSAHEETLARVSEETGVPPEYVVAILGVETRYGEVTGDDRVLDALYTLGFFHERRGAFFRKELGHYLRLAADEGWDPASRKGSYAGAMGLGQFIPSSYRAYAVDGDGDGARDLFDSPADAIASVAHYFVAHGWRRGEPVLLDATVEGEPPALEDEVLFAELARGGVTAAFAPEGDTPVRLYAFELPAGREYRVGLNNFYVITRYNHSELYARVVHELATELRQSTSVAGPR